MALTKLSIKSTKYIVMGWIVSPDVGALPMLNLVPQNVTVYGDRALKLVIKLKWDP